MTLLEAGLRGAGIALLLLLAISGWRDGRHVPAMRLTVLIDLCAIAYLIETAPLLRVSDAPWLAPLRVLSMVTPAVFLHWAAANFDDFFVPKWWRWLPLLAMAALAALALATDRPIAWRTAQVAAILLAAAGIVQTLAGRAADLVEARRRFRLALAIGAGSWIAALTLLGAMGSRGLRDAAGIVTAGGIVALALAAALLRLRVEARTAASSATDRPAATLAMAVADAADRVLLDRLETLMRGERIYREEGFGLGMLAARLAIPEYRLRRLINHGLGHRNFVSFTNTYRLPETMAALADPGQRQVPILTIALDAGFQSIGPFNRAFKAQTGRTPTEFRREHVEQAS
jgi:AraC-like DNA-binding protein